MIKYWQPMQDYKVLSQRIQKSISIPLKESGSIRSFENSWQKLRLFDTDKAMKFLLPFTPTLACPLRTSHKS